MTKSELQRLIKVEDRLTVLAKEKYGLEFCDIEWDIIPDEKMLEIMAYHIPGNLSNWKFGRDYERLRTINEHVHAGLPYEVVINSDPSRAYLMKSNTFGVQVLVMAHVIGHVAFFTMNKYFQESRKDIIQHMTLASERVKEYERKYGINDIEKIVDAGHSLQFHSSPFDNELESDKRERLFKYEKQKFHKRSKSEFRDLMDDGQDMVKKDIERFNQELWRKLMMKTPVEPTGDLLRYVIDQSIILEDWEKDILEVLREEGRYYWPQIKTKTMNEGFATYWHQTLLSDLHQEGVLGHLEHAEQNFANSLVKAMNPKQMNPYLIGCTMWENIIKRWDKGQHGVEYDALTSRTEKAAWDNGAMKGREKMFEITKSYTDWFFVQDFLTPELVDELKMYIYVMQEGHDTIDFVRTKHTAEEVSKLIIDSFAHSHIPKIEIVDGNGGGAKQLYMVHRHSGADLNIEYAQKTMGHIWSIWGREVILDTIIEERTVRFIVNRQGKFQRPQMLEKKQDGSNVWSNFMVSSPFEVPNPVLKRIQ